ncbi:beta-L-arabinofuranosidase domain-containing protein [Isoptericola croceus]|uniref:beta-L-arabinofuranosidase domain-containing protein n=1 Tax=Isoptericola croceus TaxID=3031406 RepID=UPI0023F9D86D|nr:beta-L-arabinofuranosidase domain-containing protein [Isoptericola croceus]
MAAVLRTPDLADVRLDDPRLVAATARGRRYLLSLSAERLLHEFYRVAGLPPTTPEGYGGWERSDAVNFRGHTLGHYLSALAASWASCADGETATALRAEIRAGVVGLERCQDAYATKHPRSDGYVSAFRESVLDQVQGTGDSDENVLVPWYDLHKVLAGLLDVHAYVGGRLGARALAVATRFGLAVHRRVAALGSTEVLLRTEYGGMNEALYRLLAVTGDPRFRVAAEAFDEVDLFRELAAGRDVLPGRHANTTIPKLLGALARYRVLTERPETQVGLTEAQRSDLATYRAAAEQFFDIVLRDHTYVTGANSQAEHFHAPGTLYERAARQGVRGNAETAETCNTYNMRRLARGLYELTGDSRYADYDELALRNHILASQHPERGTTTYFNAMAPGYHKVVHTPDTEFWCCTGTGMESFAGLGSTLYAVADDGARVVTVDGFHGSAFAHAGLRIVQEGDLPASDTVTLRGEAIDPAAPPEPVTVRLRVPDWAGEPTLEVDSRPVEVERDGGYAVVHGFGAGSTLRYRLPARVTAHPTPDNPAFVAFRYGPEVLSAGLGAADTDACEPTGILVRISDHDPDAQSVVTTPAGRSVADLVASEPMERLADAPDGTVRFALRGTLDGDHLRWAPHHTRWDERYAIYLHVEEAGSPEALARAERAEAEQRRAAATVDELTMFDGNNFENAKNVRSERSSVRTRAGRTGRTAQADGWFSVDLAVDPAGSDLVITHHRDDAAARLEVSVRGLGAELVTLLDLDDDGADVDGFVERPVPLPAGEGPVTVRFAAPDGPLPTVYGVRTVRRG